MFAPALTRAAEVDATPEAVPIAICKAQAGTPVTIAIFSNEVGFNDHVNPAATLSMLPSADGNATDQVLLPPGRYAIAAFQDTDGDGALSTNLIGMPTEPYGFSGTGGQFGPPTFEQAAFAVPVATPVLVCLQSF